MSLTVPKRFAILGVPGSGKTTFARRMALVLGLKHIELDELYYSPEWRPVDPKLFRDRVEQALDENHEWIMDGGAPDDRSKVWTDGLTLVWLDYSLPCVFWHMVLRTFRRYSSREPVPAGNHETLRVALWDLIAPIKCRLWQGTNHRPTIERFFNDPQFAHLDRVRLLTPKEADAYLVSLEQLLGIPSVTP